MKKRVTHGLCIAVLLGSAHWAMGVDSLAVGANPESVTRGFDGKLFVTMMGETRAEGDGNGGIVRIDGGTVTPFCRGMDDPKGIVMLGDSLVTADFKQVWKIDREGKKEVLAAAKDFPFPPVFLNDVVIAPDGKSVLVTDMGARSLMFDPEMKLWPVDSPEGKNLPMQGRVYQITMDGKVTELIAPSSDMRGPNGIDVLKDGTLRVAEFFSGNIMERKGDGWKVIATGHRSADGIVHDEAGKFYLSEVLTGKVTRYEADGTCATLMGAGMVSAADIYVDQKEGKLVVPDTKGGKLFFLPL